MLTDMLFLICPLKIMMWLSLVSPKKKILSLYRYISEFFSELFLSRFTCLSYAPSPFFFKKILLWTTGPLVSIASWRCIFMIEQASDEKIYLGPHGAPPSQAKQQELNTVGRKQRFRNKLKEADRKFSGNAQENKVENLRELMGARGGTSLPKSSPRDWLDPHCHESEFDRKPTR
jgi:hypothetical protein